MKVVAANFIEWFLLGGGLVGWTWIAYRLIGRRPVITWQPRRPVPWCAFHAVAVVWTYLVLMILVPGMVIQLAGGRSAPAVANAAPAKEKNTTGPPGGDRQQPRIQEEHEVLQVLIRRRDAVAWAVCILSAAVTAPLCEEFVFRLVLQGWLEARLLGWRKWRRLRHRKALRTVLFGLSAVVPVAVLFGAIHYRPAPPPEEVAKPAEILMSGLVGLSLAHVLTIVVGVALLRTAAGASATDLGWDPKRLGRDVALGLASLPAVAVVVYRLQLVLTHVLPRSAAAEPFSLTVFALPLGLLYLRTHRIAPSIVLHLAFNFTSLAMFSLGGGGG